MENRGIWYSSLIFGIKEQYSTELYPLDLKNSNVAILVSCFFVDVSKGRGILVSVSQTSLIFRVFFWLPRYRLCNEMRLSYQWRRLPV